VDLICESGPFLQLTNNKMSKENIIWNLEIRKISDLKSHPKNPRKFTEKGLQDLEESIKSIGKAQPLNINKDNVVLSGNARLKVLKKLKIKEVEVYVASRELSEKEEQEILIRLNKNIAGEFDYEMLQSDFEIDDLMDWGFEAEDFEGIDDLEDDEIFEDQAPALKKVSVAKRGDLWELGPHKLLCGDATLIDELEKLLGGGGNG
jgi:hypothetical protein